MLKNLILWPLSILYGIGISIRNRLFNLGILKIREFDIPIICVGNITVGGTGKTPHTESLINELKNDYRVACLSRGYKRKPSGFVLATETSTANEIGDEPMQIKNKFPKIIVAVDADRVRGIKKLMQLPEKPEVIILDDGFQHRYVKADINIMLIDYNRPIYEDHLLPLGRLRESIHAKDRANYIIVTKCPANISPIEKRIILKHLNLKAYQQLLFTSMRYGEPRSLDGNSHHAVTPKTAILCVTGIAQPAPYVEYLKQMTDQIAHITFPDHHNYSDTDIKRIIQEYEKISITDKCIFTTEKDAVRLTLCDIPEEIRRQIFYIPIEPEFLTPRDQLIKNIYDYVRQDTRK